MGRKKRDLSYLLPFCYYCDKTFENETILHQHQKAKHFTCEKCSKRFSTADLIKSHLHQSHNENLTKVPNAAQDRGSIDLKIFGMQGVPRLLIDQRMHAKAKEYWDKIIAEKTQKLKKEQKLREKETKKKARQNRQIDESLREQKPTNGAAEAAAAAAAAAEENFDMSNFTFGFGLEIKPSNEVRKETQKPSNVFSFEL